MDLKGIAAIVTGGASGLGNETARMLAANGAKVTIFDLNAELGTAEAAEIAKAQTADSGTAIEGDNGR